MYELFSVDDHIIEPADVWSSRVPARLRDVAPHVVREGAREYWEYEGKRHPTMGLNAVAGKPPQEWANEPTSYADMISGCYNPVARSVDMRSNGIFASVNFPSLPRFGGALFVEFRDKVLAETCVRAWNDFVLDEWCSADPDLFVPMIICQLWDPHAASEEIRRCVNKGARALTFPENPVPIGLPSVHTDHWDPIWAICEELGIPICMHIGSSGKSTILSDDEPGIVEISAAFTRAAHSAINLLLSPVPRRFPKVKIVWSEGGIGWVPAALERADRQFERHKYWSAIEGDLPSEICRRTMWFCMIEEPVGLKYRGDLGVDRILWESDYPHADTPWPKAQEGAATVFCGVPEEDVAMITHRNATKLFQWEEQFARSIAT